MNMAAWSSQPPCAVDRYTRDSGWVGSRLWSSSTHPRLIQCAQPSTVMPKSWKPSAGSVDTSANAGSSASVRAIRSCRAISCSSVQSRGGRCPSPSCPCSSPPAGGARSIAPPSNPTASATDAHRRRVGAPPASGACPPVRSAMHVLTSGGRLSFTRRGEFSGCPRGGPRSDDAILRQHDLRQGLRCDHRVGRPHPLLDLLPALVVGVVAHDHRHPAVATEAVAGGLGPHVGGHHRGGL